MTGSRLRYLTPIIAPGVAQTWKVDDEGNYLEEVSTDETTHKPESGNQWICTVCGARATVEA